MSRTRSPLNTVNCCAPLEAPGHATYVCNACGETEGMGPDDPRWRLSRFDHDHPITDTHPTLTCRACGHAFVTCYLEPEQ